MNMHGTIELRIADVVYHGKGLARVDGCVVFIPNVLPGEVVLARITKQRKSFAEAELQSIIQPSPLRIDPACPLAGTCPGCCYQHMDYAEELRLKCSQHVDILKRIGQVQDPCCLPSTPSPVTTGYRNKISLHAAHSPSPEGTTDDHGDILLGYYGTDNMTVIDVPSCHLAAADLNSLLADLRGDSKFMTTLSPRQTVTLRRTDKDGAICWAAGTRPSKTRLIEATSLGELRVPYDSFFQVNGPVTGLLTSYIMELLRADRPSAVVDLYCGVGPLALAAGKAGVPAVLGIDSDTSAIRAAKRNSAGHNLPGVEFVAMQVERGLEQALEPLESDKTVLIVDPPRCGLSKDVTGLISSAGPARMIYVSCASDTLARDIARLSGAGYGVISTQVFDMFPRTPHFESITVLVRK